jgi:hypothetical protein
MRGIPAGTLLRFVTIREVKARRVETLHPARRAGAAARGGRSGGSVVVAPVAGAEERQVHGSAELEAPKGFGCVPS